MITDVQQEWPLYQLMMRALYVGINTPDVLDTVIANIGPLPTDPGGWDDWLHGFAFIAALHDAIQITDAALKHAVNLVVATNVAASIVSLPAPNPVQVATLLKQLNVVNEFIKQDQRFHASLQIGKALAGEIGTTLGK